MKFFLIMLAVMILMRYLMPYIIRFLLKTFVQKQMRNAQQYVYEAQAQQQYQQQQQRSAGPTYAQTTGGNGKVKVAYVPEEKRPRKDFPGGEYVDYEEVK
ncbi:hypothetical protein TH63_16610 [Rufibacter radiotolerans]|uniref:DUF4834 domain-containing protein n=1 Tax=Rufibacter radiotolerans TaxID=1379910 RepID=A0A0H4VNK1_9BACT|nr:DUF4834 family protein [Rufibacter radiotolerans]AKQ46888.1 hypothetical protein TH63_16610 [Rufibacter radiotolerans]